MSLDFSGQNLQGRSFRGQELAGANFADANIAGTNFTGANLTGANFTGASSGLNLWAKIVFMVTCLLLSAVSGILYALASFFIKEISTQAFNTLKINNLGSNALWLLGVIGFCAAYIRFRIDNLLLTECAVTIGNIAIACILGVHGFSFEAQLLMNSTLLILTLGQASMLVFMCANFGAFCGALGYVVDGMKVFIWSSLLALLVAILYTLFGLSSQNSPFSFLIILVMSLFSIYIGWGAIHSHPKLDIPLQIANDLTSDWGTRFYQANLTEANFENANLKNADFTKAIGVKREHN